MNLVENFSVLSSCNPVSVFKPSFGVSLSGFLMWKGNDVMAHDFYGEWLHETFLRNTKRGSSIQVRIKMRNNIQCAYKLAGMAADDYGIQIQMWIEMRNNIFNTHRNCSGGRWLLIMGYNTNTRTNTNNKNEEQHFQYA